MLALPIFTASHPATIVGANELNFCVRDGNRWTLIAINTNSYGWLLTIFYIKTQQRFNCLVTLAHFCAFVNPFSKDLVTHTGFEPMLTA